MTWAQILPLAFVMIAGPQIITSFFLATSENWAESFVAFVGGAAIAITIVVTIAYVVGTNLKSAAGSKRASEILPKMRDLMNQNAWVVGEIVLVFLAAITIKSLVSG